MKFAGLVLTIALVVAIPFATTGCGKTEKKTDDKTDAGKNEKGGHPTEGPHHGILVELGDDEYHGEVAHDDKTATVTVYILDGAAKKQVPIDAKEVVINLKHDGKPEQFKLPALPDKDDPQGKSSRFQLKDKELVEAHDAEGADAKLTVRISGKSFTGNIAPAGKAGHKHP